MHVSDSGQADIDREWSAKSDGKYCHGNADGGTLCYDNVRVKIDGDNLTLIMNRLSGRNKGKPYELTLLAGKKSN